MLKRQLSRREKILLTVFAVLLLALLYYTLVDQPVRATLEDAGMRRDYAEGQLAIDSAKLTRMREMQAALDQLTANSKAIVPDYDNARQVVNLLNQAMLSAESYDMSFRSLAFTDQIVSRPIDINFTCTDYTTAEYVLRVLHDGPYRCEIASVTLTDADSLASDEFSSLYYGKLNVGLTVTFYEFIPAAPVG